MTVINNIKLVYQGIKREQPNTIQIKSMNFRIAHVNIFGISILEGTAKKINLKWY